MKGQSQERDFQDLIHLSTRGEAARFEEEKEEDEWEESQSSTEIEF